MNQRHLSPAEQLFVSQQLRHHSSDQSVADVSRKNGNDDVSLDDADRIIHERRENAVPRASRRTWWRRPLVYGSTLMILPALAVTYVVIALMQAQSLLGAPTIQLLTTQNASKVNALGIGWLTQVAWLYAHRAEIIAGIVSIALIVLTIFVIWDLHVVSKDKLRRQQNDKMRAVDKGESKE